MRSVLRPKWLLALGLLIGCGSSKPNLPGLPPLGTTWVLMGATSSGRPLSPSDIAVKRASDLSPAPVPGFGSALEDMVYAGIADADLPAGITPDQLMWVDATAETHARPPPPLTSPHVLDAPSKPGDPAIFVLVDEPGLNEAEHMDRTMRLQQLLSGLAISDPCLDNARPAFTAPRTQAVGFDSVQIMSSGDIVFGTAATSTAILGVFSQSSATYKEVGVWTGTVAGPIKDGEGTVIGALGPEEATDPSGTVFPKELGLFRGQILGHVAIFSPSAGRYIDDTPRHIAEQPGAITGYRHITYDGVDSLCMFGGVVESVGPAGTAVGAMWCRPYGGGSWRSIALIPYARDFTDLIVRDGTPPLAIDYQGAFYVRTGTRATDWREMVRPKVNQGDACKMVACANVKTVVEAPPSADFIAIVAGNKAEVDVLTFAGGMSAQAETIDAVPTAMFADERTGGAIEVSFRSGLMTQDGAVWLGTTQQFLVRIAPDRKSAARVCLDNTTGANGAVTALAATAEGKLVIGTTPSSIGVGTWQWH
jgi:hypothetical protein